ncbi:hypothetical protein [Pseudomonas sp. TMP9]|uniref:hypothetical protein n=1 Tax=Pseudomonas sp. TMP9 TaxID=3133144 RepID=UPI0030CE3D80
MPHYFTNSEREGQILKLIAALEELTACLNKTGLYQAELIQYQTAIEQAQHLLSAGFSQAELGNLNRQVPNLFWLHREWSPPLEKNPDGPGFRESEWFKLLEPLEQNVVSAAAVLRQVGEY